jgi:hypothetical protein
MWLGCYVSAETFLTPKELQEIAALAWGEYRLTPARVNSAFHPIALCHSLDQRQAPISRPLAR